MLVCRHPCRTLSADKDADTNIEKYEGADTDADKDTLRIKTADKDKDTDTIRGLKGFKNLGPRIDRKTD